MQPYYELAYALASRSLCFFVGTGFSKHITNNGAPDWKTLLINCSECLDEGETLKEELFPNGDPSMPLEECASIISLQMKKEGKSIYREIANQVSELRPHPEAVGPLKEFVKKHPSIKFLTTNYDKLIEDEILENSYTTLSPGYPVHRRRTGNEVYHIHGSINNCDNMVVTADDYYRFLNFPSYFSKKLDTLIEENTTVIIGYSLGDVNFKSILNSQRYSSSHAVNRQHLFFLSRRPVAQHVKDYYECSYGLRVIDETEIPDLIRKIDIKHDGIAEDVKEAEQQLKNAIEGKTRYTDDYLKIRESFSKILATISSVGIKIDHPLAIDFLKDIISRKHGFTQEPGAWAQYDQLAEWLIQLGCVMDLGGTPLEPPYLNAVETSFDSMSKTKVFGKSWDSFKTWRKNWGELTFKNRELIRNHISANGHTGDFSEFIHV